MSYEISDEKIPVGWLKIFELGIDPVIERFYRETNGAGRVITDYLSRCGEEFNHRNPSITHIRVVLERNPNYPPIIPNDELPEFVCRILCRKSYS